jgi:hypothetical protein
MEFFGRGGGGATGTSCRLLLAVLLMYGGSSCKSDEVYIIHTDTVFKTVNNIKIVFKHLICAWQ